MGRFRMGDPDYEPQKSPHATRNRVIGVVLMVLGVSIMTLFPLACLGLPIDGIGYLTGHGEPVTVTIVEGSQARPNSRDIPGSGYFVHDGERRTVRIHDVDKGQELAARIAITSDPADAEPKAYASIAAAIEDTVWGLIFIVAGLVLGRVLFRTGRELRANP